MFTDHVNLLTMYDPHGTSESMPRYAVNKLMRWAIRLSAFNYIIEHIPGELNFWADMLSRWANREHTKVQATKIRVQTIMLEPISPSLFEQCEWPEPAELIRNQPSKSPGLSWKLQNEVWTNEKGEIFIPHRNESLKQRIMIAAHAGMAAHKSSEATLGNLSGRFW